MLNYDGSVRAFGDMDVPSERIWPGDGTPYRMPVDAEGSREAFQQALRTVGSKLRPGDQLFINTSGHGRHQGTASGPDLVTFPYCQRLKRREVCDALAALPPHRLLVVLMSQCFSGGFGQAILEASPAAATVVMAATAETRPSFVSFEDGHWDSFQRNYVAALAGRDVDGSAVGLDGTGPKGSQATLREAFEYACDSSRANPYDSPQFFACPGEAIATTLCEPAPPLRYLPSSPQIALTADTPAQSNHESLADHSDQRKRHHSR